MFIIMPRVVSQAQLQLRFVSVAVVVARPDLFLNIVFRTTFLTSIGNILTRCLQTAFPPVRWKSLSRIF